MTRRSKEPNVPLLQPVDRSDAVSPQDVDSDAPGSKSKSYLIVLSFVLMAICFSLNHATVTTMISFAAPSQGRLGNYCTGTLYVMYTVIALLLSNIIVDYTGHKWGLVWGLGVYCFYVCSFLAYHYLHHADAKEAAAYIGSTIGGIGAGFLWTAQGGYFASTCKAYAAATQMPKEKVTSILGSVFAFIYLGGEVSLKLLSSVLLKVPKGGEALLFSTFSAIAIGSTVAMIFVKDMNQFLPPVTVDPNTPKVRPTLASKILPAVNLLLTDPKMVLLYPAQLSFAFMATFLNSYSNSHIVKDHLNKRNLGYLTAITAATATLLTIPVGKITTHISKVYIMVLGGALFTLEAVVFYAFTDKHLGTWPNAVLLYALHGAGRCIWESTNKAVMADFFGDRAPAAFANVVMANGGGSSIAFFLFPHLDRDTMLIICITFGILHMISAVPAFVLWRRRQVYVADSITV